MKPKKPSKPAIPQVKKPKTPSVARNTVPQKQASGGGAGPASAEPYYGLRLASWVS